MSKTFLQYKGSWASKLYPTGNKKKSTYKTSGCGVCAAASIIYNVNPKITPLEVGKYSSSIGGATPGGATYHSTINKLFAHYGMNSYEVGTMPAFFSEMGKPEDTWGVLLFKAGKGKTGITFTSGGHYISATAYKYVKGEHYVYLRDSGLRGHIGWYRYKDFQGLIKKAWIVRKKKAAPVKTPTEVAIDGAIAFGKKIANDNSFGYKKFDSTDHACPVCHPSTKVKGYNCIGFVAACYGHGAKDPKVLANCKANNGSALGNNATLTNVTLESWRKKNGDNWDMVTNGGAKNGKSIPVIDLKKGDVLIGFDTKGKYKHTMLYIGGGKLLDAVSSGNKSNHIAERDYSMRIKSMRITRAFRYNLRG